MRQTTQTVLMVRPANFGFNPETAASNRFQRADEVHADDAGALGRAEFDAAVRALRSEGIQVVVAQDQLDPCCPDAVFPNNWVSFHEDGTVVLYPMEAPSRRRERRREIADLVAAQTSFVVRRWVDLTSHEAEGRFLEGTGSLVIDHRERVAYASRASRTHQTVLHEWCAELGYAAEFFDAADASGAEIYHTNVLMSIGERYAAIAADSIVPRDRERVLARVQASGREVILLSQAEVAGFCGNLLELASWDENLGDCSVLLMSAAARRNLSPDNLQRLSAACDTVLAIPVPTIERLGGGSIRCMLAEVFTPQRGSD
ncbi:MAG: amidinotransferase [Pseudomonadales bacterium]|nr:amidinotransferase [Pseudomonadales bacterium]